MRTKNTEPSNLSTLLSLGEAKLMPHTVSLYRLSALESLGSSETCHAGLFSPPKMCSYFNNWVAGGDIDVVWCGVVRRRSLSCHHGVEGQEAVVECSRQRYPGEPTAECERAVHASYGSAGWLVVVVVVRVLAVLMV